MACAAPLAIAVPEAAYAQAVDTRQDYAIPSGSLSQALQAYSAVSGVQLVYSSALVAGMQSPGVSGSLSRGEALTRLLAGTGLTGALSGNTATISGAEDAGERVTGAVRVEGAQGSPYFGGAGQAAGLNGVNGSRDITATEGTGSFTSGALTIGSKVPQAMKDVPQSVSVLTSERMAQQNVTDFTTAMKQLPGVTLVQGGSNLNSTFYSRGFAISSIQVDGGAPLANSPPDLFANGYFPQIDMAQYDHVELLRGAAGTFNGYGNPSGTVNLVRKKPLDHGQILIEAQAGSWSNYSVVADASSPLALDGKLRGRLVLTYRDNHYFYDTAKDNKTLIYGIVELDVTPTMLVTTGISYTRQDSVPWREGLPRYQTGEDLKLPRSTGLVFPWNSWAFSTAEIFGGVEQKIGNDWTAKLSLTHNSQTSTAKVGYSSGAVNPLSNSGPLLTGAYNDYASTQFSVEATLTGAFEIFGQRQEITIGASRVHSDMGGMTYYDSPISGTVAEPYQPYPGGPLYYSGSPNGSRPPINVFAFNAYDPRYAEPRSPLPNQRLPEYSQTQSIAYTSLRLTAFDKLHLIVGLRWSRYEITNDIDYLCTSIPTTGSPSPNSCVGRGIGDIYRTDRTTFIDTDISWPPTVTLSFDFTRQLNGYVGYSDIYRSQAGSLGADLKPVDPITGSNLEAGLKWQARDGRLNLSIAAYRIKQKGFAEFDGIFDLNVTPEDIANGIGYYVVASNGRRVPNGMVGSAGCCYIGDPNHALMSEGIDIEATGEILPGWQVAASYTINQTRQEGSYFGSNDGLPFLSIQPKHLYKLWSSFDFSLVETDWLSGLTISAGVNGQSSGYRSGSACTDLNAPNALGISTCKPGANLPFEFTVPAYAVLSGRIDYRVSKKWSFAVNLENILDKTYYQTTGSTTTGNWYGAPRSIAVSLHGKW